jgi:hypothetical protein
LASAVAIRLLFAATIAWFPAQMLFTVEKTEPYPALTMPAFPGQPLKGNMLVLEKPVFRVQFAGRESEVVPYQTLLPKSPVDNLSIFKNAFPVDGPANDPGTLAWLESNVIRQFPGRHPSGVDIVWRRATYHLDDPDNVKYSTVRTLHVDFGRDP